MKKLAIIGSSELQTPLILEAKNMGYETYVFSKRNNTIGEKECTKFYDVDVLDFDAILEKCENLKIDGITSIASDITTKAVVFVCEKMNLVGNSFETLYKSTNKYEMRKSFKNAGLIVPNNFLVKDIEDINGLDTKLKYPVIVKPTDRAGSAGVIKVDNKKYLRSSIEYAMEESLTKHVIVEEYIYGKEYSCECVSINGKHKRLVFTEKFTTGAPNFVEIGHIQPANINLDENYVENIIFKGLDSLNIQNGASHAEFKITPNNEVVIIEIGARMAGDFIGSTLVKLSTNVDYVKLVIDIAMNNSPLFPSIQKITTCAIKFICNNEDLKIFEKLKNENMIFSHSDDLIVNNKRITKSSERFGWFIIKGGNIEMYKKIINNEI